VRLPIAGTLALTLVVFVFYVTRPAIDRNYGGVCSGLRWVFWLYPIWIVWMAPILDGMLSHRWLRTLAGILLGASVVSASIAWANPWSHPWLSGVLAAWGLD
jgi:hypothetical protein